MRRAPQRHSPAPVSPGPRSKLARWWLLVSSLVIPALFFVGVELGLRAVGYGYPTTFFVRQTVDGQACYVTNFKFSWRFFPKRMARWSSPLAIPAIKPPDAVRVFVLGSSAAQGDPAPAFGFSRILEILLQQKYPAKNIEVYNTATTAINSNVLLPIARDCLPLQPDVFVLYSGNNEVIGPYGLSAALTPFASSRSVIKAQVWLGQSRLVMLLRSLTRSRQTAGESWQGMEFFLKNKVRPDDPNLRSVYRHYQENLAELCRLARKSSAPVILSTILVNEADCVPFASLNRAGLDAASLTQWHAYYQQAQALETAGQWQAAIDRYLQTAAIDDTFAELQFRLGQCRLRANQTREAGLHLAKARDYDVLRFRADTEINEAVRRVARDFAAQGVRLADAETAARRGEASGIPGARLLCDHVHLTFEGNYLLATTVLEQIEKALALTGAPATPTLGECRDRLAFTAFSEKRIVENLLTRLQTAPFTGQFTNARDLQDLRDRLTALDADLAATAPAIDALFQKAIAHRPSDWWLHTQYLDFLRHCQRPREAFREAEATFKLIPFEYLSLVNLGITAHDLKQFAVAEDWLKRAIALNPFFMTAYENLAQVYETQKQFDQAEACYRNGGASPRQLAAFFNRIGETHAKERRFDDAIACFNKALAIEPDFTAAAENLQICQRRKAQGATVAAAPETAEAFNQANRLLKEKRLDAAIELYRKVVIMDPAFAKAHNNLGIALTQTQRYDEALRHFNEAVRLAPEMLEVYPNLAALFGLRGNHAEAIAILLKAIALKPTAPLYELLAREYQQAGKAAEAQRCQEQARQLANPPVR